MTERELAVEQATSFGFNLWAVSFVLNNSSVSFSIRTLRCFLWGSVSCGERFSGRAKSQRESL